MQPLCATIWTRIVGLRYKKAYLMSILGGDVPSLDTEEPFTLALRVVTTPNVIKTEVQTIMDDIRAPLSS